MQLEHYFNIENQQITFTRQQASHFAKLEANDFNPIHDEASPRFCVPGDLLLAILLTKEGIAEQMQLSFSGMISDKNALTLYTHTDNSIEVLDANEKAYLKLERTGKIKKDPIWANKIAKKYIQLSGMGFPHIMVPLLKENDLMINPARPLVIYDSMSLTFFDFDFSEPEVQLTDSVITFEGKRGIVTLSFKFTEKGRSIGEGQKRMICSSLIPYEESVATALIDKFYLNKASFLQNKNSVQIEQIA